MATPIYPYIQYGGIWTASQQADAKAAGTWPVPPTPKLFSWGRNNAGQLGLGNTTNRSSPNQVGSLTNWLNIAGGYSSWSLAVKTDGTLWSWGKNDAGQLGLGNTTYYSSPKQIGALMGWSQVACGHFHSLSIKTDGTLWAWGANGNGQLGLNNTTYYSSPKQVGALTNWYSVAGGRRFTMATKTDGTIWGWGINSFGQLGVGNTTYYSSPKQVGSLTNWRIVSCVSNASLAIKTDGTLWTWGGNGIGQLGLGNTTGYSSPKQCDVIFQYALLFFFIKSNF